NNISSADQLDTAFRDLNAMNMLNTKYIIINPDNPPLVNNSALGNAWFVDSFILADNPDEEIEAVNIIDPAHEAVVNKKHSDKLKDISNIDSISGNISLASYKANELVYEYSSPGPRLTVFSEIYYPEGWNAYIDGEAAEHFRVNYVLRAMVIPEGDHEIIFRFEPESYKTGNSVSLAGSVLMILMIAASVYYFIRRKRFSINADSQ
ncbi:MAG: hypothetical protein PF495_20300, partial [Spirochaetales bacterium]|nr:hypothetical protein [Spirochaetales bacterium]